MRILFMTMTFPKLSETFVLDQITGLIDRGHDVRIHARHHQPEDAGQPAVREYDLLSRLVSNSLSERPGPGRLLRVCRRWMSTEGTRRGAALSLLNPARFGTAAVSMRLLNAAIPLFLEEPFDIIHAHFGPIGREAAALAEVGVLTGKLVVSFHGHDVNAYVAKRGRDVYADMFPHVDMCTVNSDFTGEKLRALGAADYVRHPVGLDVTEFSPDDSTPTEDEPVRLVTVARLVEKKGLEYSIRAAANVMEQHPRLRYEIVGEGPLRPELEGLVRDLGVEGRVQLSGGKTRRQVRELLQHAHLFILASVTASDGDMEGQGLVLQEAQACGLPVITTWHNGIPQGVLPGESALMAPERDVTTLVEHLDELLSNPGRWKQMGRAGRAFVEESFDIVKLNTRLESLYRDLLEAS